jgi:hypothetical protein
VRLQLVEYTKTQNQIQFKFKAIISKWEIWSERVLLIVIILSFLLICIETIIMGVLGFFIGTVCFGTLFVLYVSNFENYESNKLLINQYASFGMCFVKISPTEISITDRYLSYTIDSEDIKMIYQSSILAKSRLENSVHGIILMSSSNESFGLRKMLWIPSNNDRDLNDRIVADLRQFIGIPIDSTW